MRSREWFSFRQVHLPMEDVEPFNAYLGRFVDDRFNGDFFSFEMPIGIGGNAKLDALFVRGSGCF